jgi:hypothetical protein
VSAPYLIAYIVDGWTLVRGVHARRVLMLLGHRPVWSTGGRGWAVHDANVAHDLAAYANYHGTFVTISHRRPA